MQSLGSIFKRKMNETPFWKHVSAALVVDEANRQIEVMFGQEAKHFARATHVKDKVLTIACLSSVMAQEIRLNEQDFIKAINGKFESAQVEKVKYLA